MINIQDCASIGDKNAGRNQGRRRSMRTIGLILALGLFGTRLPAQVPPPTLINLYSLNNAALPYGTLIKGPNGALYGTAWDVPTSPGVGGGAVFQLTPPAVAGGSWTQTILHSFQDNTQDGQNPLAGLTFGPDGALYGTTTSGGTANRGTVYRLAPLTGGGWAESVLYSFQGGADGMRPQGAVVFDGSGTLYGTTFRGGSADQGSVFALTPPVAGGTWTETVIHSFSGPADGRHPMSALVMDSAGVFYGTTSAGGGFNAGVVYTLSPPTVSGGTWSESVLYAFTGGADGGYPIASLVIGSGGVLYGTTGLGGASAGAPGACGNHGCGTVFSLSPPAVTAAGWTEAVLYSFKGGTNDGMLPLGRLLLGRNGTLYGTTQNGGISTLGGTGNYGTVFALSPPSVAGGDWTETFLYSLATPGVTPLNPLYIYNPYGGLIFGNDGGLIGTSEGGGTSGCGTVFELLP
jgi:uncharacterized repeat protein (TIGR03803 family)